MADTTETPRTPSKDVFSAGETKLLLSILSHLQGDLNADWAAVAAENNYKDASIAKTRWGQIKRKKIMPNCISGGEGTPTKPALTPAKGNAKGGQAKTGAGVKKERATAAGAGRKVKKEEDDADAGAGAGVEEGEIVMDEDEMHVK